MEHLFWLVFISLIIVWYIAIAVIVAVRGASDVKQLLKSLNKKE